MVSFGKIIMGLAVIVVSIFDMIPGDELVLIPFGLFAILSGLTGAPPPPVSIYKGQ